MAYRLAVFDMDGTILNTLEDLADSVNYALTQHHMPQHTLEEVRFFVGNGMGKLIERAVAPGTDDETRAKVMETFMAYYKLHSADKTRAYDGIAQLLADLRGQGILTAVVSNKADPAVKQLAEEYFPGLFDMAVGELPGVERKPAPDEVELVLHKLQVDPKDAVYIGDSDVDVATARNSGLDGIFVEWGFRDRAFLLEHGAKCICSNTEQVKEAILRK